MMIKTTNKLHNYFWAGVNYFGKYGIIFLTTLIYAQLLSVNEFGIFSYFVAVLSILTIIGEFGIASTVNKFISENDSESNIEKIIFNSKIIIFIFSGISLMILLFLAIFNDNTLYYLLFSPLIILSPIISLYEGYYRGIKKFKSLGIFTLVPGIISFFIAIFIAQLFGLIGAVIGYNLIFFFIAITLIYKNAHLKKRFSKDVLKKIFRYTILVGVSSIGYFLFTKIDILILGHFDMIEEIAYYEIVNKIFSILLVPSMIFANILSSDVTRKYVNKKLLITDLRKNSILLFISGVIIALIIFVLAKYSFSYVFPKYDSVILLHIFMLLLYLLPFRYYSTFISVGYIFPTGYAKISSFLLIIFGIINILLDLLLLPKFGLIGVIYATLISQFSFMFLKDIIFYKNLKKWEIES